LSKSGSSFKENRRSHATSNFLRVFPLFLEFFSVFCLLVEKPNSAFAYRVVCYTMRAVSDYNIRPDFSQPKLDADFSKRFCLVWMELFDNCTYYNISFNCPLYSIKDDEIIKESVCCYYNFLSCGVDYERSAFFIFSLIFLVEFLIIPNFIPWNEPFPCTLDIVAYLFLFVELLC
jgi:hypothetical protein